MPFNRRSAVNVVVFQWPWGTAARHRAPRRLRPRNRAIFVDAAVSLTCDPRVPFSFRGSEQIHNFPLMLTCWSSDDDPCAGGCWELGGCRVVNEQLHPADKRNRVGVMAIVPGQRQQRFAPFHGGAPQYCLTSALMINHELPGTETIENSPRQEAKRNSSYGGMRMSNLGRPEKRARMQLGLAFARYLLFFGAMKQIPQTDSTMAIR